MMSKVDKLNEEFQGKPLVHEGKYCTYYLVDRFLTPDQFLGIEIKESETGYITINSVATVQYDAHTMDICSDEEFNEVLTNMSNQILAYRR